VEKSSQSRCSSGGSAVEELELDSTPETYGELEGTPASCPQTERHCVNQPTLLESLQLRLTAMPLHTFTYKGQLK